MNTLDDESAKEYVSIIGTEELYESLKYQYDVVYSSTLTKNYDLLKDFFIWKYSVYKSREAKKIVVNIKYKELFDELLFNLLNREKNKFYDLVEKNLDEFDNNIFLFIQELINSIYDLKLHLVVLSVTLHSNVATLQQIVKELKKFLNTLN
uniref:hypothetical protein n=2 Tax=Aliarcobacter sp. TaxID=2321116 RepID=UPI0040483AAC